MAENTTQLPVNVFLAGDTIPLPTPMFNSGHGCRKERKLLGTITRQLHTGTRMVMFGPSGSGKTSLIHALINDLDKNRYRTVPIPYTGHPVTVSPESWLKTLAWKQGEEVYSL